MFAVEFLHKLASSDKGKRHSLDTEELSSALRQIISALKKQQTPEYFSWETSSTISGSQGWKRPPIEVVVAAIRRAQGKYYTLRDWGLFVVFFSSLFWLIIHGH